MTGDDSSNGDSTGGFKSLLRDLIETVANADPSEHNAGRGRSAIGRGRIGHDVSIGVGTLDGITDADRKRIGDADDTPTTGKDRPTAIQYDENEREAIAVIDVPGIEPGRLSAGISSRNGDLLVGTDEAIIERLSHSLANAAIAAASYHNGVLELHLQERDNP